jgi:hypothetical protein
MMPVILSKVTLLARPCLIGFGFNTADFSVAPDDQTYDR